MPLFVEYKSNIFFLIVNLMQVCFLILLCSHAKYAVWDLHFLSFETLIACFQEHQCRL